MEVACTNCGTRLRRSPSHVRGTAFCDRECRKAYSRRPISCRGCRGSFPRDPKQPGRQYCTWSCFKASRRTVAECHVCGSKFETYVSEQRKRMKRGHVACCSRDCRNVYTSKFLGGDGEWVPGGKHNPKRARRGWRKVRSIYMASVGGICEGCETVNATEVHHLTPIAAGGALLDFDNLMAVCVDCHGNMHQQLRSGGFDDVMEDIRAYA